MSERKLATIRRIDNITPIEGADLIHCLHFGGWKIVDSIGKYNVGDLVVMCEIDSFIPDSIAPFLTQPGHEPKEYNGVRGQRLRTKKLKGVYSQGLVLPLNMVFTLDASTNADIVGTDVSEILGIIKWEPPAEFSSADAKGNFPSFIPKTVQERVQNIKRQFKDYRDNATVFQITEKIDGSSITIFKKDGVIGVCSRNLELKEDDANTFWKAAKASGIIDALNRDGCPDLAFQGELIGPGIQGNKYDLNDFQILVYDIFDISAQLYNEPQVTEMLCMHFEVKHVPILGYAAIPPGLEIEDLIASADGQSALNGKTIREGLVYKVDGGQESFKVISNKWLGKFE